MKNISNFFINPFFSILAIFLMFVNFIIVLSPFYISSVPILNYINENYKYAVPENLYFYMLVSIFILTIFYLILDLLFSFTIKNLVKDCYEIKELKDYEIHQELFEEVLKKFDLNDVKFMLSESSDVNAFAIATFRKRYVVITTGMLNHIVNTFESSEDRKIALKGIIGHELSHLINWDFLPGLILFSSENITNYVKFIFEILSNIFSAIPIIGILFRYVYLFVNTILNLCYNYLIKPFYSFIEKYLSRKTEYRCDLESAQVLGWKTMYLGLYALLPLSGGSYNNLFSTHPKTLDRILKIYNLNTVKNIISVNPFSKYFGLFTIFFLSIGLVYSLNINNSFHSLSLFVNRLNIELIHFIKTFKFEIINFIKTNLPYLNMLTKQYDYIYFIGFVFLIILSYFFLKSIILNIKFLSIKKNLNTENETALDILLFFAIENNDLDSFIKLLKNGANIESKSFSIDIETFAYENNKNFLKYLKKLKK